MAPTFAIFTSGKPSSLPVSRREAGGGSSSSNAYRITPSLLRRILTHHRSNSITEEQKTFSSAGRGTYSKAARDGLPNMKAASASVHHGQPNCPKRYFGLTVQHWVLASVVIVVTLCATAAALHYTKGSTSVLLIRQPAGIRSASAVINTCASAGSGKGRRYLVTGAAGFIGFSASRVLRERGDIVIGL